MYKKLKIKKFDHFPKDKEIIVPKNGDIGIDLFAAEDFLLPSPYKTCLVKTGIAIELPEGFAFIIKDRSSKSKNYKTLAGVIDNSFRGELLIRIQKIGDDYYKINKGDKIAQGIIIRDLNNEFVAEIVTELSSSNRGEKGFGSTGS